MTAILGISAFYHDAAAALVVDGEVVAACQEERYSRKKNDEDFPVQAIQACLDQAGLSVSELDYVGFYDKPYRKFDRLLESYLAYAPRGFRSFARAMPLWLQRKLWLPREMRKGLGGGWDKPFVFAEHHESHAAGAFFPSPFEEAAILTFDGVGEWATASFGHGRGNRIELSHELHFPHSLGLLYAAFTYYLGFAVDRDEYKVMGLAPYGEPRFADVILERMVDLKPDGSFRLDMSYFDFAAGLRMTSAKFHRLFEAQPRDPDSEITQQHMDLAASIQQVTEEIVLRSVRHVYGVHPSENLCLSGGVALNCVANGRSLREGPFERIWIQPAAGDAGSALGVALFIWHQLLGEPRVPKPTDGERGALLGAEFRDDEIERFLEGTTASWTRLDDDQALTGRVADLLAEGRVVGWFQGRMEFGPRALGARSILADPRRPDMQRVINHKVKFREGFRPFAPAVLEEHASEYFELEACEASPYMLLVAPVQDAKRTRPTSEEPDARGFDKLRAPGSVIPAVTHVDGSARVQTVDSERNPLFRRLLEAFHRETGCPVLVNTSFNLSWEPIVRTPREAYDAFMTSDIDALAMGHFLLTKSEQKASLQVREPRSPGDMLSDLLASPCCGETLRVDDARLVCSGCERVFPIEEGIPRLYFPHGAVGEVGDVTEEIQAFYEENPFPDYEEHDSLRSLIDKSRRGGYAHLLHEAIPFNSTVLEVGCGTGQLSNFLGIACRRVVGADLCLNSLRLGERFREEQGIERTAFLQMNLFRPCFRPGAFDMVLCNGVLHHTSDPFGGFRGLVPLVRPGGYLVIGLYNAWGRRMTDVRRAIFRLTGGRLRALDPFLRRQGVGRAKEEAWFADQYRNPHESKHTMGEVLKWFEQVDVRFVRGVPSLHFGRDPVAEVGLLADEGPGTRLDRFLVQAVELARGSQEGGFFVMIGQRPEVQDVEHRSHEETR